MLGHTPEWLKLKLALRNQREMLPELLTLDSATNQPGAEVVIVDHAADSEEKDPANAAANLSQTCQFLHTIIAHLATYTLAAFVTEVHDYFAKKHAENVRAANTKKHDNLPTSRIDLETMLDKTSNFVGNPIQSYETWNNVFAARADLYANQVWHRIADQYEPVFERWNCQRLFLLFDPIQPPTVSSKDESRSAVRCGAHLDGGTVEYLKTFAKHFASAFLICDAHSGQRVIAELIALNQSAVKVRAVQSMVVSFFSSLSGAKPAAEPAERATKTEFVTEHLQNAVFEFVNDYRFEQINGETNKALLGYIVPNPKSLLPRDRSFECLATGISVSGISYADPGPRVSIFGAPTGTTTARERRLLLDYAHEANLLNLSLHELVCLTSSMPDKQFEITPIVFEDSSQTRSKFRRTSGEGTEVVISALRFYGIVATLRNIQHLVMKSTRKYYELSNIVEFCSERTADANLQNANQLVGEFVSSQRSQFRGDKIKQFAETEWNLSENFSLLQRNLDGYSEDLAGMQSQVFFDTLETEFANFCSGELVISNSAFCQLIDPLFGNSPDESFCKENLIGVTMRVLEASNSVAAETEIEPETDLPDQLETQALQIVDLTLQFATKIADLLQELNKQCFLSDTILLPIWSTAVWVFYLETCGCTPPNGSQVEPFKVLSGSAADSLSLADSSDWTMLWFFVLSAFLGDLASVKSTHSDPSFFDVFNQSFLASGIYFQEKELHDKVLVRARCFHFALNNTAHDFVMYPLHQQRVPVCHWTYKQHQPHTPPFKIIYNFL